MPLFEPVADAILAHQNEAALRHADETGWRVQEIRGEDRSSRTWLWTSVSSDAVSFHIDPSRSAEAAQGRLKGALDGLFAEAEQELAGLPDQVREGKALRSLVNHREGLCVFVDRPQVPLDNNLAERVLRGPVIGRRLSAPPTARTAPGSRP